MAREEGGASGIDLLLTPTQRRRLKDAVGTDYVALRVGADLSVTRLFAAPLGHRIKACRMSTALPPPPGAAGRRRTRAMESESELIDRAMSFPIEEVVTFYTNDLELSPSEAALRERELKRWLALTALRPDAEYVMLTSLDEVWHSFILFTQKYTEFCDAVAGRYIHHKPRIDGSFYRGGIVERYERFHRDYEEAFGESAPAEIWPSAEDLVRQCPEDIHTS
jgi:hypothetical protein